MEISGQSQAPAVEDVGREMTNLSCLTCSASESIEKNVGDMLKNFPRFWEKVQRFLENVRCFCWMLGEE